MPEEEDKSKCPECSEMTIVRTKEEIPWADEEPAVIYRLRCSNCGYETMES